MKRYVLATLLLVLAPMSAHAASGHAVELDPIHIDVHEKDSLVRGAHLFTAYCLSCHSASYMRYNRLAKDLDLSERYIAENLMFTSDKVGSLMQATMPDEQSKEWFGVVPPDLSLTARSRSPEWIYTYLRSFYYDPNSVSGWNNTIFENVAMPHVLHELQGTKALVKTDMTDDHAADGEDHGDDHANGHGESESRFKTIVAGKMDADEYDGAMRDLTNFMVYLSEPSVLQRRAIAPWVLLFLFLLLGLSYLLKKEYWRDVH